MTNEHGGLDDEGIDRLVAGAYYFRAVSHSQWEDFLRARAGYYALPESRRFSERERLLERLPFVRELMEREIAER